MAHDCDDRYLVYVNVNVLSLVGEMAGLAGGGDTLGQAAAL